MFPIKFLPKLFPADQVREQYPLDILSVEQFQRSLKRERARADRCALPFSVLTIDISNHNDGSPLSWELCELLQRRTRLTDIIGWFDHSHVGALLFNTPPQGAWKLAEDICHSLPGVHLQSCSVYTYPNVYRNTDCSDSPQGTPQEGNPLNGRSTCHDLDGTLPRDDRDPSSPPYHPLHGSKDLSGDPIPALEPFLSSPIPPWKRFCDIVFSLFGLIMALPFLALIAIAIKLISPGPAFFRQERIGYLGRPFTFWKFRTMKVNADSSGHKAYVCDLINNEAPMNKLDDRDHQIIPFIGKILRKSCLDELPQLLNVLLGDMSLVGPRPCLPYEYAEYRQWHKRRFDTLPGMTGLWQINGKNKTTFTEMIRFDIAYEQQRSLWLDLKIIFKTLPAIINQMTAPPITEAHEGNEICH